MDCARMLLSTDLSSLGGLQTDYWCFVRQAQANAAAASLENEKPAHFLDHHSSLID